ncbi:MAG TPA: hypothetical protein VEQ42_05215 [Pyrinomonadaceae bacterium]|nr:hypothetical protein [Pyrinomonadaceae bacterium]
MEVSERPARWRELDGELRALLAGRLAGLYGALSDEQAFDALGLDKQRALLIFARRLAPLKLWRGVARVTNVWGTGGVGMDFDGRPLLASALSLRRDFTTLWASHGRRWRGFRERRVRRAALHFLREGDSRRRWSVHFDLDNPLASVGQALSHLVREVWRGETPDWQVIEGALAGPGGPARADAAQLSLPGGA